MNRRDTIVVAVLINAGVLIVLFTSALKSKGAEEQIVANTPETIVHEIAIQPEKAAPIRDEVDQVISQLTTPSLETTPAVETPAQSNFATDLNTFSQGSIASSVVEPAAPVKPQVVEVKVKKGDFLAKIARRHNCTVEAIMKANRLSSTNLKIGQVLKIPAASARKAATAAAPVAPAETAQVDGEKYYIVRRGDNPWTIAVKNKIKVEDLLRLNNLDANKAKHLKPGDKLRVS